MSADLCALFCAHCAPRACFALQASLVCCRCMGYIVNYLFEHLLKALLRVIAVWARVLKYVFRVMRVVLPLVLIIAICGLSRRCRTFPRRRC